jgi:predicted DsbA family dithiol-disulfide isomerase
VTYFQLAVDLDEAQNLLDAVNRAGLDSKRAADILATDEFAADVRAQQMKYTSMGIHSVPSIIINDKYLLQGAQPAEAFEEALRQVAAET